MEGSWIVGGISFPPLSHVSLAMVTQVMSDRGLKP